MMEAVPLPPDIVARFEGKVMAITGHEADQVFKSDTAGTPDVSVPITWALVCIISSFLPLPLLPLQFFSSFLFLFLFLFLSLCSLFLCVCC